MNEAIRLAMQEGQYAKAEKLLLEQLAVNPLSAQGWVQLGEVLLQQNCGDAARLAFDRGWLLDPMAQWVPSVQQLLAKAPVGPARPEIQRLLAPKRSVTVAAAIMTRNEARCIERCVFSLLHAVDEILIIDSSSTDGTVQLVAHLPKVKVITSAAQNDDFAAKRNQALPHLNSDWVLWVDADEWLFEEDVQAVRQVAEMFDSRGQVVLNICQVNYVQGKVKPDFGIPRMFPLGRGLHYYGRVHEQVVPEDGEMYETSVMRRPVRIRLHHDGYEPNIVQSRSKINRNLRLLEMMVAEDPSNPGWFLYYGRESLAAGDREKAKMLLLEAERLVSSKPSFGRHADILMLLGKIYLSESKYEEAIEVCSHALKLQPNYPDASYHLARAQMKQAAELLQKAERNLVGAKVSFQTYRGIVAADESIKEWRADLALADLTAISGKNAAARAKYESLLARYPELTAVRERLARME
ncbi:tetratricopeptide repeat-containing glycosyltransferase family 2 protein [Paenibacillus albus]|uniref:Glycosyltransferase n=1 Tax=Paenibacillus albus TaxID=2495582 RepID=A0A3Q8X602_9BACL|nr:glycosyltransferase [Paenibacillus albus]AZN39665.1 glycosyltransferase [Paenibacillus albus]